MISRRSTLGLALLPWSAWARQPDNPPAPADEKKIYLSFDTGHMGVANLIADTLKRFEARATFFLANEPTLTGGFTLDDEWAPWWKARAGEGHDFGAHTWDHDIWLEDLPPVNGMDKFKFRTVAGINAPVIRELTAVQYGESLKKVAERFKVMTGSEMGPIFRAPAGKTSKALLGAAKSAGFEHVGWSPAGFLGDELSSERFPNAELLEKAIRTVKPGDVLLAHLGIWSRLDPWAPAVLEPLMRSLKDRGCRFAPLREHPRYASLFRSKA